MASVSENPARIRGQEKEIAPGMPLNKQGNLVVIGLFGYRRRLLTNKKLQCSMCDNKMKPGEQVSTESNLGA